MAITPLIPIIMEVSHLIFLRRKCANTPESEVATVYNKLVAIAITGENPIRISVGVRINPPPIPKKPDIMPILRPNMR